jgi:glycogen operon protein
MDSLRYWVIEMHVDGFRFDLGATLARELHEVDKLSAFFDIIHQDPVISQVKLIAEPWDLGEGGYQVGNFPVLWTEWNGEYRNAIRRYWSGDPGQIGSVAYRLTGSSDLYEKTGRRPYASINFITAHDGFCLDDLVSYNCKHNEENLEGNRDGSEDNLSWNCGVEGPSPDPEILELRERQKRNFLATLLFSQGVPMILSGDEIMHTKKGNNNTYCQDNELNWLNWNLDSSKSRLLSFVRLLITIRQEHPVFRRRNFFRGRAMRDPNLADVLWLRPDGKQMNRTDWTNPESRAFGMMLIGDAIDELDERGNPVVDDTMLLVLNAAQFDVEFALAEVAGKRGEWEMILDTIFPGGTRSCPPLKPGGIHRMAARSVALFRFVREGQSSTEAPSAISQCRLPLRRFWGAQRPSLTTTPHHRPS